MNLNRVLTRSETAKHELEVELDHHCAPCGKTSAAWVRGTAVVVEKRTIIDQGGSDAAFLAETEAQRNAALLIRLARCPRCHRRDGSEMRKLAIRFGWMILGVECVHVYVATTASFPFFESYVRELPTMALLLAAAWIGTAWKIRRDLRASDDQVRFVSEVESLGEGR